MRTCFAVAAMALTLAGCDSFTFDKANCAAYMAGTWTGDGTMGLPKGKDIDSRWEMKPDGTITGYTRHTDESGARIEQSLDGTWRAAPGRRDDACEINWNAPSGAASMWSVRVKGRDTIGSFDGVMERQ